MIYIERTQSPMKLEEQKEELKKKYLETGASVWNKDFIKKALLEMSHNKCAFCECTLNIESKYMEVEHFFNKSNYSEKVVDWE
ncbi:MAG: HNH endonuclease, partial [Candidatus Sericytochromatia bacterium]